MQENALIMMAHSSQTKIVGKVDGQFLQVSLVAVDAHPLYRTLDRRRFGMRRVGMLLALSASCVFPFCCACVCVCVDNEKVRNKK